MNSFIAVSIHKVPVMQSLWYVTAQKIIEHLILSHCRPDALNDYSDISVVVGAGAKEADTAERKLLEGPTLYLASISR